MRIVESENEAVSSVDGCQSWANSIHLVVDGSDQILDLIFRHQKKSFWEGAAGRPSIVAEQKSDSFDNERITRSRG